MSSPKLTIRFAADARKDVRGILLYTRRQWGDQQRDAYRTALDRAFETLTRHPEIGQVDEDLPAGVRRYPVRSHVILYRIDANTIRVLRVLHQRMDVSDKLDP